MEKYYKFKNTFVFADNGNTCCICPDGKTIMVNNNERGDGTKLDYNIDLLTGDINLVRVCFKETYVSTIEAVSCAGTIRDIIEIKEEEAIDILVNNKRTVGYLLKNLN